MLTSGPRPALVLALALGLVAVACGDGDGYGSSPSPTAPAAAVSPTLEPTPEDEAAALDVSLVEFSVTVVPDAVPAGPARFTVTNDGDVAHQFLVIATDLAPAALPLTASGFAVDLEQLDVVATAESADGDETMVKEESVVVETDLVAGSYVLICNVPGHYESGMVATLSAQ